MKRRIESLEDHTTFQESKDRPGFCGALKEVSGREGNDFLP